MLELRIDTGNAATVRKRVLLLSLCVVALLLAYQCRDIVLPLLIALVTAIVLDPVVDRMEERGWSRSRSSALIFGLFFITAGSVLAVALPATVAQMIGLSRSLGQYLPSESESETKGRLLSLMHKLHASSFMQAQVLHLSAHLSHWTANLGNVIASKVSDLAPQLIWVVLVPIMAFYILKDFHVMLARALLMVPHHSRNTVQNTVNEVGSIFVKYLRGLVLVCGMNAVATAAVLQFVFHLPNAIALGAISGLLYTIPYLGPIVTIAITMGVALMTVSAKTALIAAGTLILLHSVIFDQIITPRVVGREVGLHPVLAILALLVGGSLMGITGMIISVPVAATIQMCLGVLYPKLNMPIVVPEGKELHEMMAPEAEATSDDNQDSANVHQTIVQAVDFTDPDVPGAPPPGREHLIRHGNADLS